MKIVYMLRFLLLLVALSQVFAQKCEGNLCLRLFINKILKLFCNKYYLQKKICVNMFHKLGQWFKLKI